MDHKKTADWDLASGSWTMAANDGEIRLNRTVMGNPVAASLGSADIAAIMNMRRAHGASTLYPPDFNFSPIDGAQLASNPPSGASWIAPSGASAITDAGMPEAVGLKRTRHSVPVDRLRRHDADSMADMELPLPPPGEYEFFSGTFGTVGAVLLALDTGKGTLFGWLPASKKWQPLLGTGTRLLSESNLPVHAWRAEMAAAFNSRLYIPTEHGLAMLVPDFAALQFRIDYVGNAPVVGAPVAFDHQVWAPIRHENGVVQFVFADAHGVAGPPLRVDGSWTLGEMGAPCAYGRLAVWPCAEGQLRLQKMTDGSVAATFLAWPNGITPHFEFGSAHMARSGSLWQLCFDSRLDSYVYVRLGVNEHEQVAALNPRIGSGTINYRFATKLKTDPWVEPEHGDDGAANTVVVPLLELGERSAVLALRIDSTAGLGTLLNSAERMRAQLVYDDENNDIVFHTIAVSKPWELRLFLHDGYLWAYHPGMQRILGWDVQQ
ncbi:hypothetical protein IFU00_14850 [Oxalobacteraceae sp. CFBP 8761]|nr:hypothetical protein [Oxalobacteraceae sp. CFBP 8761]